MESRISWYYKTHMEGDIINMNWNEGLGKWQKKRVTKHIKKNDIKEMENRRKYKKENTRGRKSKASEAMNE